MQTYLLTWNPKLLVWSSLEEIVEKLRRQGSAEGTWSMGSRKHAAVGSRIFLMRVGLEPRGLVGSGTVSGEIRPRKHWDPKKAKEGKTYPQAPIRWDALSREPFLAIDALERIEDKRGFWSPQAGGITIPPAEAARLEAAWRLVAPYPRKPQPPANDLPQGDDLLDVAVEVGALAESVALREASPPLAVGVLGGWGAGKSFVLHLFEERLREIRCHTLPQSELADFPYVGHVYAIRFDAWTYAKSNLWASLMRQIFFELDRHLAIERAIKDAEPSLLDQTDLWHRLVTASEEGFHQIASSELGRQVLEKGVGDGQTLWGALKTLRAKEIEELARVEEELATLHEEAAEERATRESEIRSAQERRAKWVAFVPAYESLLGFLDNEKRRTFEKLRSEGKDPPSIEELKRGLSLWRRILGGSSRAVVGLVVFAIVVLMVPVLLDGRPYATIPGAIVALGSVLLGALEWSRKWSQGTTDLLQRYLDKRDAALEANARRTQLEIEAVHAEVDADRAEARADLEARRERHLRRVGPPAERDSLPDFIRHRLEGASYDRRLGLMHQVRQDIQALTATLLPEPDLQTESYRELFPRGDPRIFLIIDDLDRCPPKRVVEMLEAVQLLVKTKLFVVVLAMDLRYVTRALEKAYEDILIHDGAPSGLDYIEKIVQIPYRVRPIATDAVEGFLREHMDVRAPSEPVATLASGATATEPTLHEPAMDPRPPEPAEPIPREALEFLEKDVLSLRDACFCVDISPRSAKRMVNVFKLLKIVWHRRGEPGDGVQRLMALILALSERYPVVLRELLPALEYTLTAPGTPGSRGDSAPGRGGAGQGKVLAFLADRCDLGLKLVDDSLLRAQWESCREILTKPSLAADDVELTEFGKENARLASSFSFVGDPMWEHQTEPAEAG
jgi:hypothetical protein